MHITYLFIYYLILNDLIYNISTDSQSLDTKFKKLTHKNVNKMAYPL